MEGDDAHLTKHASTKRTSEAVQTISCFLRFEGISRQLAITSAEEVWCGEPAYKVCSWIDRGSRLSAFWSEIPS